MLKHPGQPLLLLKQSHNAHNLLSSKFNDEGLLIFRIDILQPRVSMTIYPSVFSFLFDW